MPHRCVFLDRDGTINEEVCYLSDVSQLRLLDGAAEGIALLNRSGFKVVVVTNQAAVARGYLSEVSLTGIHHALESMLRAEGAAVDAIYYCPHHATAGIGVYQQECGCRKPKPGLLRRAAKDLDLDLSRSFVIGDKLTDLGAGRAANCQTILVRTGYGRDHEQKCSSHAFQPNHISDDLKQAAEWILQNHPCDIS